MTLMARYSGVCPECDERWQPGALIRAEARRDDGLPIWQHAVCPDTTDDISIRPGEHVCETCWLVHPEGACDR